jgi:hypothetical protein
MCLFATLVPLSGCVSDDDYSKTLAEFQQASDTLTTVFQSLMVNANINEENHFIDTQAASAEKIDLAAIRSKDLFTPDQIKLRISAIKAIADYTAALATLASGKPADQIQADAAIASSSLKVLSADATAALTHSPPGAQSPDYSTPVQAAASAIGEVITLIEKHRSEAEIKESLRKNDPQLKALFDLMSKESTDLYSRQKSIFGATGDMIFFDYATARRATPPDRATLQALADRLKQYQRDSSVISSYGPAQAIEGFQKSHDAMVEVILAPKEKKKESLAQLIAAVKAFAGEVTPLAQDIYTFGKSF